MGKKSKRNRSTTKPSEPAREAPALRAPRQEEEKETKDNLRFQDPFVEEIEDEEGDDDEEWDDVNEDDANNGGAGAGYDLVQSWNPLTGERLKEGQELEMDPTAYKMHHALSADWPSLSFDIIRDDLGDHRTRFPHCLTAVMGSQADRPEQNQLTVLKLSDLARMQVETEDDILGEEYDKDKDDDDLDESDDEIDLDPVAEHYSMAHHGGVNRVRCMPQQPHIVATWSDVGKVNLFNVESILERFAASTGRTPKKQPQSQQPTAFSEIPNKPFYSYNKHRTEGYALDWSRVKPGQLVSGDCDGNIHLWTPKDQGGTGYTVSPAYQANEKLISRSSTKGGNVMKSVEDLQWSPSEATVFASAECGGYIRVFDIRAPGRSMLNHQVHANGADVNVLSWNRLVTNLLASGSDDGVLSVWDLRKFSSPAAAATTTNHKGAASATTPSPLARFTPHKSPITSVEWHPTDESMVAVTDDVGAYIYDLSVEEDEDQMAASGHDNNATGAIPPQLLFVHSGSEQFKEVHWHPQISSCLMTTALSGYSVFIPSNL
ncbi:hypothetical protein ACA910_015224 [Epithemia clementina (nom. ined.)]